MPLPAWAVLIGSPPNRGLCVFLCSDKPPTAHTAARETQSLRPLWVLLEAQIQRGAPESRAVLNISLPGCKEELTFIYSFSKGEWWTTSTPRTQRTLLSIIDGGSLSLSSSHQVAPTHQLMRSDSRVLIFYFSSIIIYYLTSPFGLLLHRWIIENIKFALPCCPPLPLLHLPHYAAANAANVAANATNTETWMRTRLQVLADVSFSENLLKIRNSF